MPTVPAAAAGHAAACAVCQERLARLRFLRDAVQAVDPTLDQITRARVEGRIVAALGAPAVAGSDRPGRRPRWPRIAAVAATTAVAAAALLVLTDRVRLSEVAPGARQGSPSHASPVVAAQPSRALPARPAPPSRRPVLRIDDRSPDPTRLDVPAGARARAALGERARMLLLGPTQARIVAPAARRIDLALGTGTLVVEYHRHKGGALRVFAGGVKVDVIGTLFSVQTVSGETRVAVARGLVRVTDRQGRKQVVRPGQEWRATSGDSAPCSTAALALFAELSAEQPAEHPWALPAATPTASTAALPRPMAAAPSATVSLEPTLATAPGPEALYAEAETAMRRGDGQVARKQLETLLRTHPVHSLAAIAGYELAQMAVADGNTAAAIRHLDAVLAANSGRSAVDEPARHLRCRVEVRAGRPLAARACLDQLRRMYPGSPRDEDTLFLILRLTPPAERCAHTAPMQDYVARFPNGARAHQVRSWWSECMP